MLDDLQARGRITPACAGNRRQGFREIAVTEDHPRVCGEQQAAIQSNDTEAGSPPRVRGTGCLIFPGNIEVGITPACAGNRDGMDALVVADRDHPRVCGEQAPQNRPA